MRIVLDTNVLFAALVARNGLCAKVVEQTLAGHELFLSQFILSELTRNLAQKAGVDRSHIDDAIASLTSGASMVEPAEISAGIVRDPNDAAIIGTAVAARAQFLISGDKDILILGSFGTTEILSPRKFYDRLLSEKA